MVNHGVRMALPSPSVPTLLACCGFLVVMPARCSLPLLIASHVPAAILRGRRRATVFFAALCYRRAALPPCRLAARGMPAALPRCAMQAEQEPETGCYATALYATYLPSLYCFLKRVYSTYSRGSCGCFPLDVARRLPRAAGANFCIPPAYGGWRQLRPAPFRTCATL